MSGKNDLDIEGYKNTKQRTKILQIFKDSNIPLSAEDIFVRMKEYYPLLAISTIYRNLEILTSKGIVIKSIFNDGIARYELSNTEHRHHLKCIGCNTTVDIDACPLKALEHSIEAQTDFDISGHSLELYGYCPKCKIKNTKSGR